ncbi:class I SAM-dependent methyltransferase [Paenibacillus sp. UNC451MF]|uniref:class I SAM-dependent methyltransferase n=1 Tax=Paenibacillus sp. UNC451MF TaxID=1449063 RepID=UPI00048E6769|nr:class I SAM-dependent methyltransferase [Paenibacillus sp. UNC451MF]
MIRFWEKVIKPILIKHEPKRIVEIGVFLSGRTTIKLLEYCKVVNGKLTVIDPIPYFNTHTFQTFFPKELVLLVKSSIESLPTIESADVYLIDGDHNWYTVYQELSAIEEAAKSRGKFPIIILHDIEWPYGRRDSYYFPDLIPSDSQLPYAKKGIVPNSIYLAKTGGLNSDQNHAIHEYGAQNGVLTAIEDFLKVTSFSLTFHRLYTNNGLGILMPSNEDDDRMIQYIIDTAGL